MIDDYQQRYERSIYFVDSKGSIVVSGKHGITGKGETKASIRDIEGLADQADAILAAGKGSFEYKDQGHRHFVNVRYIPELKWHLFVVKQETSALSEIKQTIYLNLALYFTITAAVLLIVYFTINRYQRRLVEMATTDNLTGLANRHALELLLDQGTREASRQRNPMSAIMFDIDHFKKLNDSRGHLVGDLVLQGVATTLKNSLRTADIACRWGGEEFLVILKDTDLAAAARLANNIRSRIEQQRYTIDGSAIAVTVSAGVAAYHASESQESFVSRVDSLLYQAKREGRNRMCSEIVDHDVISA
jgi:diguanylate cyclase (GGDEF)-like protein